MPRTGVHWGREYRRRGWEYIVGADNGEVYGEEWNRVGSREVSMPRTGVHWGRVYKG